MNRLFLFILFCSQYYAPGDPAKTPMAMKELSLLSPALMVSMPMEAASTILCRKMAPNDTHTLLTPFCW